VSQAEDHDPAHILAQALQRAHLDVICEDNPHGIVPGACPLPALGAHRGYLRMARRLIARGVIPPTREQLTAHNARLDEESRNGSRTDRGQGSPPEYLPYK
jgi:hypothetical protein